MRFLPLLVVPALTTSTYRQSFTHFRSQKSKYIINMAKRELTRTTNASTESKKYKASQTLFCPTGFNIKRARALSAASEPRSDGNCVVYWMSRDQRVHDNWSFVYAQGVALSKGVPLKVIFNLVPSFLGATARHFEFMLRGLEEVETALHSLGIPFYLLMGQPQDTLPSFVSQHEACAVIADFTPMRIGRTWYASVVKELATGQDHTESNRVPFIEVDARNIVPCWVSSEKLEYSARTIRSKIQALIPEFLTEFPVPVANSTCGALDGCTTVDWRAARSALQVDTSVGEVDWLVPGRAGAMQTLQLFLDRGLKDYAELRNDPNKAVSSNLSPYFHFGQLSVARAVLSVKSLKRYGNSTDSFVEEAVVRRELAENFCLYNPHYDSLEGASNWAKETLTLHDADPRSVVYSQQQLEEGRTHDDLWNAAQLQMTQTGKMHGFLRMYWAKKILEWTPSAAEALRICIYLNDRYELDGRDPSGYVGCMWSIAGVHDQGWGERPVFGKIRYMNYAGCKRKFDVAAFVAKYPPAARNAKEATQVSSEGGRTKAITDFFSGKGSS